MSVFALGLNHTTAPLDLRGRFALAPQQLATTLKEFRSRLDRVEEVAEYDRAREARQLRLRWLRRQECGRRLVGDDRLGDARRRLAARGRVRQPEEGDPLAAAHEQLGRRQHEHDRAAGGDDSKLKFVELAFPDMPAALNNKLVDAAWIVEPFLTVAKGQGT